MKLMDLRDEYLRIRQKGYEKGFTIQEYRDLKRIQNQIDSILCSHQQKWADFYNEIASLLNLLYVKAYFILLVIRI